MRGEAFGTEHLPPSSDEPKALWLLRVRRRPIPRARQECVQQWRAEGFETTEDYYAAGGPLIPERRLQKARDNHFADGAGFAAAFQAARRDGVPLRDLIAKPPRKPLLGSEILADE